MTKVAQIFDTMDYGPAPEEDKQAKAWITERGAPEELLTTTIGRGDSDMM